MLICRGNLFQ